MARVTVEDCLEHVDNKFELAALASKRARQLARGAQSQLDWEDDKPSVLALREIADGMVSRAILDEPDLPPISASMEAPKLAEPTEEDFQTDDKSGTKKATDADE